MSTTQEGLVAALRSADYITNGPHIADLVLARKLIYALTPGEYAMLLLRARQQLPLEMALPLRLGELDFSVRTVRALYTRNIVTIKDLLQHTESSLLLSKNFGPKAMREVRTKLGDMGLRLGMLMKVGATEEA